MPFNINVASLFAKLLYNYENYLMRLWDNKTEQLAHQVITTLTNDVA